MSKIFVNLGNTANTLTLGDSDYIVTGGDGSNTLTLGAGTDQLTLGNGNNTLTLGGGTDQITGGTGNNTVTTTGVGADTIRFTDGNNTISLGNGAGDVTLGNGLNTVTTGDGNSNITLGNGFDQVTTGNGNSTIIAGNGAGDTIFVGTGANTIAIGTGSADIVHTGGGGNTVAVSAVALGLDTVMGALTTGNGLGNTLVITTPGIANIAGVSGFDTFQLANGQANSLTFANANFQRLPGGAITVLAGDSGTTVDASALSAANAVKVHIGTGASVVTGGAGNDTFYGSAGQATVNGGAGVNTMVFSGQQSSYVVTTVAGVTHVTGLGEQDTLTNIQQLTFAAPPCFAEDTRIATAQGAVAVQALRGGDQVLLADGGLAEVVWLGHRKVDCRQHPRPQDVMPIRVIAGAFGPGLPLCDLRLSPDHAVFVDGVLIPVRYLLNGRTVLQESVSFVTYFHVELASHAVLLAEGLPCESYLETGNRTSFANGGAAVAIRPDFARDIWAAQGCAELVLGGARVTAVRDRLLRRALALGHQVSRDAELIVQIDGRCERVLQDGRGFHVRIPPMARVARVSSRSWVPGFMHAAETDMRILGVAITNIRLSGTAVALDDGRLSSGWHVAEPGWRWTDGAAAICLSGETDLSFDVAMAGDYWCAQAGAEAGGAVQVG